MGHDISYLVKRNGVWHYQRRVPNDYAHLDRRGIVRTSTKVKIAGDKCGTKAGRVAARINATVEAYWRGLADDKASEARQAYSDAVKLARSFGLDYQQPARWAEKPIHEVLARIETAMADGRMDNPGLRKAVLGGVGQPAILLSSLMAEYEITQRTKLSQMSPNQQKKWGRGKRRSIKVLIELVGDKAIEDLTRDDALAFADWWVNRAVVDKLSATTVNKNISNLGAMLRAIAKRRNVKLDNVFAGTRIEKGKDNSRKPFSTEFIRNVILADGKLDGLNDEARDVAYVMMETGARPPEIINLSKNRIVLDDDVPHIKVKAEGRLLKTDHSERDIPLVGRALEAMRRHPNGFPRYVDNGDDLSDDLMKHFREHGLLPSEDHSIYSFRHSFKDRLKAAKAPEEMIDELMGHRVAKPKYGDGYGLQLKAEQLQAICFTSPVRKVARPSRMRRARDTTSSPARSAAISRSKRSKAGR